MTRLWVVGLTFLSACVAPVNHGSRRDAAVSDSMDGCSSCADCGCGEVFFDSFETGNTLHASGGVRWLVGTRSVSVSSAQSHTGEYALEFAYSGRPDGGDGNAEQGFVIPPAAEFWAEYWFYVPENYEQRLQPPPDESTNWSFFSVFEAPAPSNFAGVAALPSAVGSRVVPRWFHEGREVGNGIRSAENLITTADHGQWVRYRYHLRRATTTDTNDGLIELWKGASVLVRWDDLNLFNSDNGNQWDRGYLLGTHNGGFSEDTTFYIDDVAFYTSDPGW